MLYMHNPSTPVTSTLAYVMLLAHGWLINARTVNLTALHYTSILKRYFKSRGSMVNVRNFSYWKTYFQHQYNKHGQRQNNFFLFIFSILTLAAVQYAAFWRSRGRFYRTGICPKMCQIPKKCRVKVINSICRTLSTMFVLNKIPTFMWAFIFVFYSIFDWLSE